MRKWSTFSALVLVQNYKSWKENNKTQVVVFKGQFEFCLFLNGFWSLCQTCIHLPFCSPILLFCCQLCMCSFILWKKDAFPLKRSLLRRAFAELRVRDAGQHGQHGRTQAGYDLHYRRHPTLVPVCLPRLTSELRHRLLWVIGLLWGCTGTNTFCGVLKL